jgi:tetratricopeptide (TPR) repeat protein
VRGLEIAIRLVQTPPLQLKPAAPLALLLAGVLAACAPARREAPLPPPPPRPAEAPPASPYGVQRDGEYPRSAEAVSGPAVLALLEQARQALAAGRPEQAVASLETALGIEPRNPFVWQLLAGAHLAQRLPDQAESKARRSNSLARGNPWIEVENWRLIAAARQDRGDLAGARQAWEKQAELQARLPD